MHGKRIKRSFAVHSIITRQRFFTKFFNFYRIKTTPYYPKIKTFVLPNNEKRRRIKLLCDISAPCVNIKATV